jgi:hypothetical protein
MIQRIKPLPLAVVLPGSEAKQQKEKYILSTLKANKFIFSQIATNEVVTRTSQKGKAALSRLGEQERTF